MEMVNRIKEIFLDTFASTPEYSVRAPGRVNLLGEHVVYNDGFVLPAAIDRATYIGFSTLESDRNFMLRIRDRERKLIVKIRELWNESMMAISACASCVGTTSASIG